MANFSIKKFRKLAKGFFKRGKNCPRIMIPRVHKALQKAYKGRHLRRREYKKGWIIKIDAGTNQHGILYQDFMCGLSRSNIELDRKSLATLAENEPFSFKAVIEEIKVQMNHKTNIRPYEMDFSDAIDRNFLVYGPVMDIQEKPIQTIKVAQERIEYREQNPDAPQEELTFYETMDEWKDQLSFSLNKFRYSLASLKFKSSIFSIILNFSSSSKTSKHFIVQSIISKEISSLFQQES